MYREAVGVFWVWWYVDVVLEKFTTRKCCGEKMRQRLDQS